MVSAVIVTGVIGNIISVVGVVILNKYITDVNGFNFMVFLSFLHFAFTAIAMRLLLFAGAFTYTPAPISSVFPVAVWSCLSVGFMNLNLQHNSVGFYQLSKLVCIPVVLVVQYALFSSTVTRNVLATLIPILFGVGYATINDLDINFVGFAFASCAVVATALAQIFTNTYQNSLQCDAMQLLYHTSPIIAAGMLGMSPFFDDLTKLPSFIYTDECIVNISLSCFLALGVNISNYLVLGKTSPLTYQVLGHMKTILVIILGIVVFDKPVIYKNILGVAIAMFGVIAYTELKRRTQPVAAAVASKELAEAEIARLIHTKR